MAIKNKFSFPDRFKSNPREAEVSVFQGPRIIPSSFKTLEAYVFKNLCQTIFNNDYAGWDANLNGTGVPNFENLHFDTFDDSSKVETEAGFLVVGKTFKYSDTDMVYYVDIYADSISATADFAINDCIIYKSPTKNIWRLYCTTGTDAVKRAQVLKTLFWGTDSTDPRASSTYITNPTAMTVSDADDVGMKGQLLRVSSGLDSGESAVTGTFAVGTNLKVSSWSRIKIDQMGGAGDGDINWELPSGTILQTSGDIAVHDETGTDLEADEYDTPTDCRFKKDVDAPGNYVKCNMQAIILTAKTITWADGGGNITIDTDTDFEADGFTKFTAATIGDVQPWGMSTTETLTRIINGIFLTVNYSEDTTLDAAFDVSANEGATWTENITPNAFTLLKGPGKKLIFRVRKTGTDASKEITIHEWAIVAADFATED